MSISMGGITSYVMFLSKVYCLLSRVVHQEPDLGLFRCNVNQTPIGAETGHVHISFPPMLRIRDYMLRGALV